MARSFLVGEWLALPALDAQSALALSFELLTRAKQEKKLPIPIERARKRFAEHTVLLQNALEQRLSLRNESGARNRQADEGEDGAFSALYLWLGSWARLPAKYPQAAQAQQILATIFPEGLKFTQLPYKKEWAEAETRLGRIESEGFAKTIDALGGRVFLQNLRESHAEYGRALGITAPGDEATQVPLREPLEAVRSAMRGYVLQVISYADSEGEEAVELADRLLSPLHDFERPGTASHASPDPEPEPVPPALPPEGDGAAVDK